MVSPPGKLQPPHRSGSKRKNKENIGYDNKGVGVLRGIEALLVKFEILGVAGSAHSHPRRTSVAIHDANPRRTGC